MATNNLYQNERAEIVCDGNSCRAEVEIKNESLTCPIYSALIAKAASRYDSSVKLVYNENIVDAKKILEVMALNLARGDKPTFIVCGIDARECIAELSDLVMSGFEEYSN